MNNIENQSHDNRALNRQSFVNVSFGQQRMNNINFGNSSKIQKLNTIGEEQFSLSHHECQMSSEQRVSNGNQCEVSSNNMNAVIQNQSQNEISDQQSGSGANPNEAVKNIKYDQNESLKKRKKKYIIDQESESESKILNEEPKIKKNKKLCRSTGKEGGDISESLPPVQTRKKQDDKKTDRSKKQKLLVQEQETIIEEIKTDRIINEQKKKDEQTGEASERNELVEQLDERQQKKLKKEKKKKKKEKKRKKEQEEQNRFIIEKFYTEQIKPQFDKISQLIQSMSCCKRNNKNQDFEVQHAEYKKEYTTEYFDQKEKLLKDVRIWNIFIYIVYLVAVPSLYYSRWQSMALGPQVCVIIQSIIQVPVTIGLVYSFVKDLFSIYPIVLIQGVQIFLYSFLVMQESDSINVKGNNILICSVSSMFLMFNTLVTCKIINNIYVQASFGIGWMAILLGSLIGNNYKWANIQKIDNSVIVIFVLIGISLVLILGIILIRLYRSQFFNHIKQLNKINQFKQILDEMRDGYIVIENSNIEFANEMMRLILCKILNLKDLFENTNQLNVVQNLNPLDAQIFYVNNQKVESNDSKINTDLDSVKIKKSFKSESTVQKTKDCYSLREICLLSNDQLKNLTFSFEKTDNDVNSADKEELSDSETFKFIKGVIKNLKIMKDIQIELLPTFKYFKIMKILTSQNQEEGNLNEKITLSFVDFYLVKDANQTHQNGLKINEILNIIKSQLNYNNGCTLNGVVAINKQLNQLYQQLLGMFKLQKESFDEQLMTNMQELFTQIKTSSTQQYHSCAMAILNLKDLFFLSQIKTKQLHKEESVFNINNLVEDVISMFQNVILKNEITVTCQYVGFPLNFVTEKDSDLDMIQHLNVQDLNLIIKGDEKAFRQVLANLIQNSLKFTKPEGNVHIKVQFVKGEQSNTRLSKYSKSKIAFGLQLSKKYGTYMNDNTQQNKDMGRLMNQIITQSAQKQETEESDKEQKNKDKKKDLLREPHLTLDKIVVSIVDNGNGIKTKDFKKIFKLFGQSKSKDQNENLFCKKGVGMGLFICQNIVNDLFDGLIDFKTQIKLGTIFEFSMPIILIQNKQLQSTNDSLEKTKSISQRHQEIDKLKKISTFSGGFPNSIDKMTDREKISKMMSSFSGSTPNINSMVGRICVNTQSSTLGHEMNFENTSSILPVRQPVGQIGRNNSLASNIMSSDARIPFQIYSQTNIQSIVKSNTSNQYSQHQSAKTENNNKILIVDDEKFNCDIIEGFLMVLGMQDYKNRSEACYNGEQAVDKIQKALDDHEPYRYTLILMDCNMPFLDGYEATKQIRRLWKNIGIKRDFQPKIIAVTGHVEEEYVLKAMSCGMDRVYPKPFPIKDFGKLLKDMQFIKEVPEALRLDTVSDQ